MSKDYQEIILTSANLSDALVSDPGYVSISGTFDGASVTISLTDDSSNTPISVFDSTPAFTNPVTAALAVFIYAHRLTFTVAGGGGSENISVKWYPVHVPF